MMSTDEAEGVRNRQLLSDHGRLLRAGIVGEEVENILAMVELKEERRSLGGVNLDVWGDRKQIEYFDNVFFPGMDAVAGDVGSTKISLLALDRNLPEPVLNRLMADASGFKIDADYFSGELNNMKFVGNRRYGFVNFTFFDENGVQRHVFVGKDSRFALTSFAKANVFWALGRSTSDFMVAHSSCAVDTTDGLGLVLSTSDRGDERKRQFGKTTTALALVTRFREMAFAANDEVILSQGRDGADSLRVVPMPNEISIRQSGVEKMFGRSRFFDDYQENDPLTGEQRRYFTHGDLDKAGYAVETRMGGIKVWFFVDLNLTSVRNIVRPIDDHLSRVLLDNVLFEARHRLAFMDRSQYHWGEVGERMSQGVLQDFPSSDWLFDELKRADVKFCLLQGSVDPDRIAEAVGKYLEK